MDINASRLFMKNFFEKLYKKLYDKNPVLLKMPDLPEEMLAEGADPTEEWNVWKLITSTVTEEAVEEREEQYGLTFPNCIKAFLTTYHHCFKSPIGRNLSDDPFYAFDNAFNPHLAANGYLPFSWDKDGYFILCVDLANMPDEERCPIVQFDHELLFDLQYEYEDNGEEIPKQRLTKLAQPVSANFYDFLNENT